MEGWQLIFVFFIFLMLARIIPRIIKQRKMKLQNSNVVTEQPMFQETKRQDLENQTKPESKEMMVLGQIVRDYKTFGQIRKNTGLDYEELNSILEDLEKKGLMKVEQKKGLLGIKVELLPTEKGYREYDS